MNHPLGPLALADLIGLDVCLAIMKVLQDGLDAHKYRPAPLLEKWSPTDSSAGNPAGGSMSTATDIREQVVELAREFAKEKIEPFAAEWDRTSHFPRDVVNELGKLGFLGMCTPEEYDGMALDTVTYLMVLEEISAADAALAVSVGIHNAIPTTMLVKHGTPEQRERWLKPMARGEILAGFALSEPEAGSDAASLRSQATKDGKNWVLTARRRGPRTRARPIS